MKSNKFEVHNLTFCAYSGEENEFVFYNYVGYKQILKWIIEICK